jgi:hypothetical protein
MGWMVWFQISFILCMIWFSFEAVLKSLTALAGAPSGRPLAALVREYHITTPYFTKVL